MKKKEALGLLKQFLGEIPKLRELRPDASEYKLWQSKVKDVLCAAFGEKSREYYQFGPKSIGGMRTVFGDKARQEAWDRLEYLKMIDARELELRQIIQKYEILGVEECHLDQYKKWSLLYWKEIVWHWISTHLKLSVALGAALVVLAILGTNYEDVFKNIKWLLNLVRLSK